MPELTYPADLPITERRERAPRRHPRAPGRRRGGRDRLGQEHPAPEALPRARPGRRRARSATPSPAASPPGRSPSASPRSSAPRWAGRSASRCASPTRHGASTLVKVMTDGILLAEIQRDRDCCRPTTRSSSTRPTSAASTSTSCSATSRQLLPRRPDLKVDHHLGHHRHRPLLARTSAAPRSSRCPAAPTRWRCATGRIGDEPGDDRDQVAAIGDAVQRAGGRGPRRRARVPLRRARDPRHRRGARPPGACRDTEVLPALRPPLGGRAAPRVRTAPRAAASCWPPTSPRRR